MAPEEADAIDPAVAQADDGTEQPADETPEERLEAEESVPTEAGEVPARAEIPSDEGAIEDVDMEPTDVAASIDVPATVDVTDEEAPSISLEPTDADEASEDDSDEVRTYYQRSTGIPLSERIKIARKSG